MEQKENVLNIFFLSIGKDRCSKFNYPQNMNIIAKRKTFAFVFMFFITKLLKLKSISNFTLFRTIIEQSDVIKKL